VNETIARMRADVTRWDSGGDRRCVFLAAYATMTEQMAAHLHSGVFTDPAWVNRLLVRFAEYYFEAVDVFDTGAGDLAPAWRVAFEGCGRDDLNVLQHLFLGINAHINHDLAFAVADVLDDRVDLRMRDYLAVNQVIDATVDLVQSEVIAPRSALLAMADRLCGPLDEWVFSKLIAGWRRDVWEDARAMVQGNAEARLEARSRVTGAAHERALFIVG
jgi:hypothetical protein